jgi:electron transfer flavoprotein beta subunit
MKIAVCIKQVPDSATVSLDPETHTLVRSSAGTALNPLDEFPVELALQFKDHLGAEVTAITMGPPKAEEVLARAIGMGVDKGILLCDPKFAGGDTWATSLVLSEALKKYGPFDLVFCGKQAIDGDTAQVGPEIAAHLNWAQAAGVNHIEIPSEANPENILVSRLFENGTDRLKLPLPAVVMVLKEAGEPRFSSLDGRLNYFKNGISRCDLKELDLDADTTGLKGSPTRVVKTTIPEIKRQLIELDGTAKDQASKLATILKEKLTETQASS